MMKHWFFAVCLTLSLSVIGNAQERDPKTFFFDNGLKVKSVERTAHPLESLLGVHIWEFEVELSNAQSTLECTLSQATENLKSVWGEMKAPLEYVASHRSEPMDNRTKAKVVIALMPLRDGQVSPDISTASALKLQIGFGDRSSSQLIKNPALGYGLSIMHYNPYAPASNSGKPHKEAIALLGFDRDSINKDERDCTEIYIGFAVKPYKKR